MAYLSGSEISCGVAQLHNLDGRAARNIEQVRLEMQNGEEFEDDSFAFVLFSDTVGSPNGRQLAAYIKEHKLGSVAASPIRVNPNTTNKIRVWTWSVNQKAVRNHR